MVGTVRRWEVSGNGLDVVRADTGVVPYVADPSLVDVPLHLDELEDLAAAGGKEFLKDQRKIEHLLHRVTGTVRQHKLQIQQMARDIRDMQTSRDRVGTATTLSPMDSVQFLSDEQKQTVFGVVARQQLEWLRSKTADATNAATNANMLLGRVRGACNAIMADESIPAEVRERFAAYLSGAPDDVGAPEPVDVPLGSGSPFVAPANRVVAASRVQTQVVQHVAAAPGVTPAPMPAAGVVPPDRELPVAPPTGMPWAPVGSPFPAPTVPGNS